VEPWDGGGASFVRLPPAMWVVWLCTPGSGDGGGVFIDVGGPQVLAGVFTFASSHPAAQCLVLTLLAVACLVLHLRLAPMHDGRAQGLQTVLLSSLVGVALSGAPFAITLEAAAPSPRGSLEVPAEAVARVLQVGGCGSWLHSLDTLHCCVTDQASPTQAPAVRQHHAPCIADSTTAANSGN
jgi:hypothetical protein